MEKVVIAHGLWMPGLETWQLRSRLRAAGYQPVLFRYPTVTATLSENIERLARFVGAEDGDVIHLVGYSLGGVVAVGAAAAGRLDRPGRIVCLGSPLNGTVAGRALENNVLGAALVGRSIAELNAKAGLQFAPAEKEIGCVAGNGGFGAGRVIADFDGPNDGTVAVNETRLDGITDHVVLPVTHTTMLFDAAVARQAVAFLRGGRFESTAGRSKRRT